MGNMEIALYRKYRPQTFKEIKGQDHIISVLENEAKTDKVSHAYLFSGSRGTGKTSIARIFAKSLGVSRERCSSYLSILFKIQNLYSRRSSYVD